MKKPLLLVGLLLAGAYLYTRGALQGLLPDPSSAPASPDTGSDDYSFEDFVDQLSNISDDIVQTVAPGTWTLPPAGAPYAARISAAEAKYGIPTNLLARQLWAESHFRPDIISGAKRSSAGAIGIAQFMPATAAQYGIDPLNVDQAIDTQGKMMQQLYQATGSWAGALASYNWGIGNLQKYGIAAAPAVTQTYIASILGDLGLSA